MKHAHSTQPVIATEKTPGEVIVLPPVQVRRPTPPVRRWLRETVQRLLPPLLGLGLLLLCWQLAAINGKGFPTPLSTFDSALTPVCRSFLSGRAERHGHRLERAGLAATGGGGLRVGGGWWVFRWAF